MVSYPTQQLDCFTLNLPYERPVRCYLEVAQRHCQLRHRHLRLPTARPDLSLVSEGRYENLSLDDPRVLLVNNW